MSMTGQYQSGKELAFPIEATGQAEEIRIRDILDVVRAAKWTIAGWVCVGMLLSIVIGLVLTPAYEAHALLQIENNTEKNDKEADKISSALSSNSLIETELQVLQSQAVLAPVISRLHLDIDATPVSLPVLGKLVSLFQVRRQGVAPPLWGLRHYAWGGEHIEIDQLQMPPAYENKPLQLVAGAGNSYQLFDANGRLLLTGSVGQLAHATAVPITLRVRALAANAGTAFSVRKLSPYVALNNLKARLRANETGKVSSDSNNQPGVIQLQLTGPHPNDLATQLNVIAQTYQQLNVEYRSENAQKKLNFLNREIPKAQAKLNNAEIALRDYRMKHGTVTTTGEAESSIKEASDIEKDMLAAELQLTDLREKYTDNHPNVIVLKQKLAELQQHRNMLDRHLAGMPQIQLETTRRERDAKVAADLYTQLVGKAQELQIVEAGKLSNVKILEHALPPVWPNHPHSSLITGIGGLGGLLLGCLIVFMRNPIRSDFLQPVRFQQRFGIPVFASIAHRNLRGSLSQVPEAYRARTLAAYVQARDVSMENIKSLRTTLLFKRKADQERNVVMVTGASPNSGKTFVTFNLALAIAQAGKNVLLVDGDMRKGILHQYLAIPQSPGLSDVLSGPTSMQAAIRKTSVDCLHLLACGRDIEDPAELLMRESLKAVLQSVAAHYDWIIIDTPPSLAVTDAMLISTIADFKLLVVRANQQGMEEVEQAVQQFHLNGLDLTGLVLNDIAHPVKRYGHQPYPY